VIAAVNGFAMGGGFMLVERTDLRVAVHEAVFEVSEAKRWLLGGYNHGHLANLASPVAMEMALGFRFTAERFHQLGFINRLVAPEALIPTAMWTWASGDTMQQSCSAPTNMSARLCAGW
jgi:enoyl-CoA hydratase/carnithine racemase